MLLLQGKKELLERLVSFLPYICFENLYVLLICDNEYLCQRFECLAKVFQADF